MELLRCIYKKIIGELQPGEAKQEKKCTLKPNIIAFGNVLLDMTVKIDSTDILERYNLGLDKQGEISIEVLKQITEELSSRTDIECNPGGSALNSCRILKRLGKCDTLFFGSIGQDKTAKILKNILIEKEICTRLQETPDYPSGQCFCFVYGNHNSLYANVGASTELSSDYIKATQNELNFLANDEQKQLFYIEGFFLPKRFNVCQYIIENYILGNRKLCFNLNAPYIIHENIESVQYVVEHSYIIFGNQTDFTALAQAYGLQTIENIVENLVANKMEKILIITNGPEEVNLYQIYNGNIKHSIFPVDKLPEDKIVDITGAGDSFVAGFLDAFIREEKLEDCIRAACVIARKVVTQIGCNLP